MMTGLCINTLKIHALEEYMSITHCQILQLLLAVSLRPQNPSIRRNLLLVLGGLGRQTRFGRVQIFRYHVATALNHRL